MALNIKKLGTRAITALVFVIVLLGSVLWNYYSFTIFFFVISMWGLYEFFKVSENFGMKPQRISGFIGGVLTYIAFINTDFLKTGSSYNASIIQMEFVIFPFIILAGALFSKHTHVFTNAVFTIFGILYAVLPFALLHEIVFTIDKETLEVNYFPYTLIGIILLIWCNDTFAYLGGGSFGRNIMIARISPGKTWEGTFTGILASFGASFLIRSYLVEGEGLFWPLAGILVPVLSTIGDLVQSMLKRQANVKDTGTLMPGHGGILDRFDSLIFVVPFIIVIVKLIALQNVSG